MIKTKKLEQQEAGLTPVKNLFPYFLNPLFPSKKIIWCNKLRPTFLQDRQCEIFHIACLIPLKSVLYLFIPQ